MAFAESRPTVVPPRRLPTGWPDYLLTAAAAVGLFVSIHDWFDRMSGIQKEPGTMLVIVACGLILAGLWVVLVTPRRWVRRLFEGLILLGAVLTGIAAWFLMSWWLLGAMVVATLAQLIRLALRLR